jgi:hypothetical protein
MPEDGQSPKNPVTAGFMHHRQNPLEYTSILLFYLQQNFEEIEQFVIEEGHQFLGGY